MAEHDLSKISGSALQFAYDSSGQLTRSDISSCEWVSSSAAAIASQEDSGAAAAASGAATDSTTGDSTPSGSSGDVLEYWYSSGGYTKVPASLQERLAAGKAVVIEAGAIIPASATPGDGKSAGLSSAHSSSSSGDVRSAGVTRWLLRYRASDGLLESARLEQYKL
jgi:hypothetical protein